jgi:hypothetical protein
MSGGNPPKVNNPIATLLIRMPSSMKDDIVEICKAKDISMCAFTVGLYQKAINEYKGTPSTEHKLDQLRDAKNRRLILYAKILKIQKLLGKPLGGKPSKRYRDLETFCASLGLKVDFSNLDEVTIKLIDYEPQQYDNFDKSDLSTFQELLELMKEHSALRHQIDIEMKRLKTQIPSKSNLITA